MRLKKTILIMLAAQIIVAALVFALTYLEYKSERDRLIMSDLLTLRFMTLGKEYDHSFRTGFYDVGSEVIGGLRRGYLPSVPRPDPAKTTERTIEVILAEDIPQSNSPQLTEFMKSEESVSLREVGDDIQVAAKLYREGESEPYGIARIVNSPKGLMRQVVQRNLLLYIVIFLLINGQAATIAAILSRPAKGIVYEKGYLKEHALGALKLQHKILGDIIADHEEPDGKTPANLSQQDKVIRFPEKGS